MRLIISGCLLLVSTWIFADHPTGVPQVPSSIEIAGMKLKITDEARREIQKDVDALRASDKYFRIKLDRVNLYFPIIERVFKEEGVPDDLKYLSVQESALISDAVSTSDAVGYWQFKDFTAREVGLRVDNKVDERKNIVSASRGAARYFKRNNVFFSNWMYAVNAYMTGPGGAQRYVDRSNFGKNKMTIDKKTHWYVKRFIAHVIAFRDEIGDEHSEGLKLVEYTRGANKHLDEIARQFGTDEESVKEYNKWLRHGKVPDDKVYTVIVPVKGKVPRIREKEMVAESESPAQQAPIRYPSVLTGEIINQQAMEIEINGKDAVIAAPGDDLLKLAAKTGVSPDRLTRYNDLKPRQSIKPGQIYYVQNKRNRSPIRYHVVQYGETLWGISQKYGVKLKKIAGKNRMEATDPLKAGRLLWLRKKRPADQSVQYFDVPKPVRKAPEKVIVQESPPVEKPAETKRLVGSTPPVTTEKPLEKVVLFKYHPVGENETLEMIADYYEVSEEQIRDWNEMEPQQDLKAGMNLRLKTSKEIRPPGQVDSVKPPESVANEKTEKEVMTSSKSEYHTVLAGESLWGISRLYDVTVNQLKEWNNLMDGTITVGRQLLVSAKTAPKESQLQDDEESSLVTVIVKRGDNLFQIARTFEVSVEELIKINELDSTTLFIGQELKVIQK